MMRPRLKDWRQTLGILLTVAAFYIVVDVFFYLVLGLRTSWEHVRRESSDAHQFVLVAAAVLWGIARLMMRSPTLLADYRRWLMATPWEFGKPLPKGTLFITPADLAGLAVLALVMREDADGDWAWPVYGFAVGYLLFLAATLGDQKEYIAVYVMAVLAVPVVSLFDQPVAAVMLIAAVYLVAALGLRHTLRAFPWPQPPREKLRVGWPFDLIAPRSKRPKIADRWAIAVTLLAGWTALWITREIVRVNKDPQPLMIAALSFYGVVMVFGRIVVYLNQRKMPVNLWGRIWRGVFWVPRYDIVWLAPMAMVLAGLVTAALILDELLPPAAGLCAGVTAITAIALLARPTMEQWDLTGHHFLARVNTFAAQQQKQARRQSTRNLMALRKLSSDS